MAPLTDNPPEGLNSPPGSLGARRAPLSYPGEPCWSAGSRCGHQGFGRAGPGSPHSAPGARTGSRFRPGRYGSGCRLGRWCLSVPRLRRNWEGLGPRRPRPPPSFLGLKGVGFRGGPGPSPFQGRSKRVPRPSPCLPGAVDSHSRPGPSRASEVANGIKWGFGRRRGRWCLLEAPLAAENVRGSGCA